MAILILPASSRSPLVSPLLVICLFVFFGAVSVSAAAGEDASDELTLEYYKSSCPTALEIIRSEMECAVRADPRNAAAMIRLHFHDCFVQGCDGSVLLDDTYTVKGEKTAKPNRRSLIGFELVDRIKNKLEAECPGAFSCADLLAVAARDATILVGGPYWDVPLGRKDSKNASPEGAETDLPMPDQGLVTLISKFVAKGLSATDMVALAGSHTVGMARCASFRKRIHGEYQFTAAVNGPISAIHLEKLKADCPLVGGDDDNVAAMDYVTPYLFDNSFFQLLVRGEGLLDSDVLMYSGKLAFETGDLVQTYARDAIAFFRQFSDSMVKMGNITNPQGGEVRKNWNLLLSSSDNFSRAKSSIPAESSSKTARLIAQREQISSTKENQKKGQRIKKVYLTFTSAEQFKDWYFQVQSALAETYAQRKSPHQSMAVRCT